MNALLILIRNRVLRVLGGTVKVFSYFYHFLFPRVRFTLPPVSPPRRVARSEQKIPRVIWQTNFTDRVTLPVYVNYLVNRFLSPEYEHRFVSTEGREEFIRENFPADTLARYRRLRIGAAQADYWRVLVLWRCGGVYLDLDAHTVMGLDRIIHPEDGEVYLRMKGGELSNYFIASEAGNPNLEKIIRRISDNIDAGSIENIFDLTGPGVFNAVLDVPSVRAGLYRYTAVQGSFTNEHFQYIDKPAGKWTKEQQTRGVLDPAE